MEFYVFDLESDGLNATKIHCLSYCNLKDGVVSTLLSYGAMKEFLLREGCVFICHNGVRYDKPTAQRILGITIVNKFIDTLPVSWYIEPKRKLHGLESFGVEFGVPKPKIDDWENQSIDDYVHRCEEDVKINYKLWLRQYAYLKKLYSSDGEIGRLTNYFQFKMDCVREQEEVGLAFDEKSCKDSLFKLQDVKAEKIRELIKVMPKVPIKKKKVYKNANIDERGNLFQKGELFYDAFASKTEDKVIETIKGWKEPKPTSPKQIKDWLYSLGWVPEHIKHQRNKKTGVVKQIPQIASKEAAREGTGEVCPSIKKLYKKEPKLELLEGLSVASHRIGLFEGFLKDQVNGRLYATMVGLTNTMRLKHKTIVNLPAITKKYGEEVRKCIIADEGHVLCGSDLSNIEDRTKRHYIYKYDPKYVEDMNTPGYCAHLEIAILAGFMTQEDSDFYKKYEKDKEILKERFTPTEDEKSRFKKLKAIRNKSKITNFSATYKIGAPALARNSGMKKREAIQLLEIYWKRNKAILEVENSLTIKTIGDQKWLYNPVSGYWYSLRADKDKFSTLNQGTAVYVFDIFLTYVRKLGIKVSLQYHDEILFNTLLGEEEKTQQIIQQAMQNTNDKLKLNIQVGCGTQWGQNYAACH